MHLNKTFKFSSFRFAKNYLLLANKKILTKDEINNICFLLNKISWHLNFKFYDLIILFFLKNKANQMYDLIYVNNETLIGEKSIYYLKKISKKYIKGN